jgi:SET domain-containing protein
MEVDELFLYTNHSCDPSAGLGEDFRLRAIRDIAPGEEITWDYETWMWHEVWTIKCRCGSPKCRGRINPEGRIYSHPDPVKTQGERS